MATAKAKGTTAKAGSKSVSAKAKVTEGGPVDTDVKDALVLDEGPAVDVEPDDDGVIGEGGDNEGADVDTDIETLNVGTLNVDELNEGLTDTPDDGILGNDDDNVPSNSTDPDNTGNALFPNPVITPGNDVDDEGNDKAEEFDGDIIEQFLVIARRPTGGAFLIGPFDGYGEAVTEGSNSLRGSDCESFTITKSYVRKGQ